MRILHIISSGGMYGAEAVILNLSRTLNQQGHTSLIGTFANASLQLHERALAEGIESHLIPCRGQLDRAVPAAIRALAASTRADVIHAHGYKADVYTYIALRNTPLPLVSTCHTWYDDNLLLWLYGVIDRRVLRRYNAVVAVSDHVRDQLLRAGVDPSRVHFIRNGIDLRPFTNTTPSLRRLAPEGALIVGWVGRLTHDKGPDIFLRAIAQVRAQLPNVHYFMVGEGPYRPQVERLITHLALGDIVHLLGQRSDMPGIYASCDLMVSTSRQEGLPMAILEGMAASRPWIATSVGAVPLAIHHNHSGLLLQPEDADSLAHALNQLLKDSAQRKRMANNASSLAQSDFSAERMAADYLQIYGDCEKTQHDACRRGQS